MMDDAKLVLQGDKLQVFRPMSAHGMGLHYRLLTHNRENDGFLADLASLILASSRSGSTPTAKAAVDADDGPRKMEKQFLGVVICVGMSGLPYAHCSSSLQYQLSQRVHDCLCLLSSKRMGCSGVIAAKTVLATLLATEEEGRKTNEVADAARITAIPESGEDNWLGTVKKRKGKRLKFSKNINFAAAAGLLTRSSTGETNLHVEESATSNEVARALMERLTVLSVAENDSTLRPYETSGQQRKANLDLMGNKSRFRNVKRMPIPMPISTPLITGAQHDNPTIAPPTVTVDHDGNKAILLCCRLLLVMPMLMAGIVRLHRSKVYRQVQQRPA